MKNYALIGDVHSQYGPLHKALSYCQSKALIPVILGDVFDSRCDTSESVEVYRLLRQAQSELGAVILRSNHQDKLERYMRGNNIRMSPELRRTLDDFIDGGISASELLPWLESLPYGFCFKDNNDREYRCSHAYFPSWVDVPEYQIFYFIHEVPKKARQLMMYGPNTRETRDRVFWWEGANERSWTRVAGHYHVIHNSNNNIVLDGGCGGTKRSWFCDEPPVLCLYDTAIGEVVEFG
jgi:hypothetical protein